MPDQYQAGSSVHRTVVFQGAHACARTHTCAQALTLSMNTLNYVQHNRLLCPQVGRGVLPVLLCDPRRRHQGRQHALPVPGGHAHRGPADRHRGRGQLGHPRGHHQDGPAGGAAALTHNPPHLTSLDLTPPHPARFSPLLLLHPQHAEEAQQERRELLKAMRLLQEEKQQLHEEQKRLVREREQERETCCLLRTHNQVRVP